MASSRLPERATTPGANELAEVLRESTLHAGQLLAALESERDALRSGDVDAIHAAVASKHTSVQQLERLDAERVQLCAVVGIPADIATLSRNDATGQALTTLWSDYLSVLERCRDANLVNARVTAVRRRHVEQALGILRGGDAQAAAVYGPGGRREVAASQKLGQA